MSFLGAGCKLFEGAGLEELWGEVYARKTIPKMIEGKAYSKCVRACMLTDAALHLTLLKNEIEKTDNECNQSISKNEEITDTREENMEKNIFDQFNSWRDESVESDSTNSEQLDDYEENDNINDHEPLFTIPKESELSTLAESIKELCNQLVMGLISIDDLGVVYMRSQTGLSSLRSLVEPFITFT